MTRRPNCPTYKKRISAPAVLAEAPNDKPKQNNSANDSALFHQNKERTMCKVIDCKELSTHSVRRKWAIKMTESLTKTIQFNLEHTITLAFLPICDKHYDDISHMMKCALCSQILKHNRNHIYYINQVRLTLQQKEKNSVKTKIFISISFGFMLSQDSSKLEQLLSSQGIPVLIGSTPVACKQCRYYVSILLKPREEQKEFMKIYRRKYVFMGKAKFTTQKNCIPIKIIIILFLDIDF